MFIQVNIPLLLHKAYSKPIKNKDEKLTLSYHKVRKQHAKKVLSISERLVDFITCPNGK